MMFMRSMKYYICKYLGSEGYNGDRTVTLGTILIYSMMILCSGVIGILSYHLILDYGGLEALYTIISFIAMIAVIFIIAIIIAYITAFIFDVCNDIVVLKCKRR